MGSISQPTMSYRRGSQAGHRPSPIIQTQGGKSCRWAEIQILLAKGLTVRPHSGGLWWLPPEIWGRQKVAQSLEISYFYLPSRWRFLFVIDSGSPEISTYSYSVAEYLDS